MYRYPAEFERDDNDTYIVRFPDIPEAITFGEDVEDALRHAGEALEAALSTYMDHTAVGRLEKGRSRSPPGAAEIPGRPAPRPQSSLSSRPSRRGFRGSWQTDIDQGSGCRLAHFSHDRTVGTGRCVRPKKVFAGFGRAIEWDSVNPAPGRSAHVLSFEKCRLGGDHPRTRSSQ